MARINKHFFEMAQNSAREGVKLTTNHGGAFDWDVAMIFLKMSYYYTCTVDAVEKYNEEIAKVIHD